MYIIFLQMILYATYFIRIVTYNDLDHSNDTSYTQMMFQIIVA